MNVIIVIILVYLAFSLFRPHNRPQVVVVQREVDNESPSITTMLVIFVIALVFFTNEDFPKTLAKIIFNLTENTTPVSSGYKDSLNKVSENRYPFVSTLVPSEKQPSFFDKLKTDTVTRIKIEPLPPAEVIRPIQPPLWAIVLKKYTDSEKGYRLQEHFLTRNIQVMKMTNGEFWAVIVVQDEFQGKKEVEDWKRHWRDWCNMNLIFEIRDLNNP